MIKKIKNQKEIVQIVKNLKRKGKKIVTISGGFDILHVGHISTLEQSKSKGDVLIILLNSDKSVRAYKGPNRPINSQKERVKTLTALESVDYVVIFDELTPNKILEKIRPDIHCNSFDWGKNCVEKAVVEKNGGKIHILKLKKGFSTTNLIKKILTVYLNPAKKAIFLDRDGTININQPEYIFKKEDFKFIPLVIPALRKLSETDYKIIIIANQPGIGQGYFSEKDLKKLHQWMVQFLKEKKVRIDKIYYCPHKPEDNCSCRKPKIGLLIKAAKDFNLSLNESWFIGNDEIDVIAGREANIKTIKIGKKMNPKLKIQPNYFVKNLLEATKIILNKNGK